MYFSFAHQIDLWAVMVYNRAIPTQGGIGLAKRPQYETIWTQGKKGSDDAFYVRACVFVIEQGFQVEFDDLDKTCWHLTVYDRGEPIGAARIYQAQDGAWQLGRICVLEEYRGKKVGRLILSSCEEKIRQLAKGKPALARLGAQVRTKGFYLKNGYTESGEEYLDEYCPHITMTKEL